MSLWVTLEYRCDFCEQTAQMIERRRLEPLLLDAVGKYPTTWTRRGDEFVCPLHRVVVRDLQGDDRAR